MLMLRQRASRRRRSNQFTRERASRVRRKRRARRGLCRKRRGGNAHGCASRLQAEFRRTRRYLHGTYISQHREETQRRHQRPRRDRTPLFSSPSRVPASFLLLVLLFPPQRLSPLHERCRAVRELFHAPFILYSSC